MALIVRHAGMRELSESWSARIDSLMVGVGLTRRILPALVALVLSVFAAICLEDTYVASRGEVHSARESMESRQNENTGEAAHFLRYRLRTLSEYKKFDSIETPKQPLPANSTVRKQYAKLASIYLKPFKQITRKSYLDYLDGAFNGSSAACSGCFLVQIKDAEVYVFDPLNVRNSMAEFRLLRMREALYWTVRAVESGAIRDTEFLVSTTDGVACTSRAHMYRMGPSDSVPRPIFTVSRCNVSDNIPFPMVFSDILRRAFPDQYWVRRVNTILEWDNKAAEDIGAQRHESHAWANKIAKAVFRGSIRVPAILTDASEYEKKCREFGRTGLLARAAAHAHEVRRHNTKWSRKYWLWNVLQWPQIFFTSSHKLQNEDTVNKTSQNLHTLLSVQSDAYIRAVDRYTDRDERLDEVLDVQISGTCGKETHRSDKLNMEHQSQFKYSIYVEGNSFWADRLALQMFGSSAIIKQITPCGMFFEPLLKAYEHYIPTDYHFADLVNQVRWARNNDESAQQIVRNARKFAGQYLSLAGVQAYAEELLGQYADLLADRNQITLHPLATKLYPLN